MRTLNHVSLAYRKETVERTDPLRIRQLHRRIESFSEVFQCNQRRRCMARASRARREMLQRRYVSEVANKGEKQTHRRRERRSSRKRTRAREQRGRSRRGASGGRKRVWVREKEREWYEGKKRARENRRFALFELNSWNAVPARSRAAATRPIVSPLPIHVVLCRPVAPEICASTKMRKQQSAKTMHEQSAARRARSSSHEGAEGTTKDANKSPCS